MIFVFAIVAVLSDSGYCQRREMCMDRPWLSSAGTDVYGARVVDAILGSAVAFQCNYCGEKDGGEARFWYTSPRWNSSGNTSAVTANGKKEVVLGMAEPLESNRVYMTSDHSLVIQNSTLADAVRYSCTGFDTNDRVEFALDLLSADAQTVSADSMADWSRYESLYLTSVSERYPNVRQIGVDWDAWGPCNGCVGKRYRRAACRVQFNDTAKMACRYIYTAIRTDEGSMCNQFLPFNVDSHNFSRNLWIVIFFLSGSIGLPTTIPPSLVKTLSLIPDFVLAEKCYSYCQPSRGRLLPKYKNTFLLEERSSLTLACAEATINDKVTWRRDGLLLSDSNTDETSAVSLDTFGTLYMVGLTSRDSGNYTCYVNSNRTQEVILVVRKSSLTKSQTYTRHLYYLYYVFTLYFVLFSARIYYAFLDRRNFLKITENDVLDSEIPTVYLGKQIRIR